MNRIKCLKCGDILHSKHRHDFVTCKCHEVFLDGGDDYRRVGGDAESIAIVQDDGTEIPLTEIHKRDD